MEDFTKDIDRYIGRFSRVLDSVSRKELWESANLLMETLSNGSKIFVISENASIAERTELILNGCRFGKTDKRFNCQSMCQNIGYLTDVTANDYSHIFSLQLEWMVEKDDLLIAFSYDGDRKNIVKAAEYSKICGCKVMSIIGGHGGRLLRLSNAHVQILENDKGMIDSVSAAIINSLIEDIRKYLGHPPAI